MRFEIKSFRGGKSDYSDRGISGSFLMGKNLNIRGEEDVLVCNQALVSDGTGASGADTVVTDLILWIVNSTDGNTYCFGDSGKIYKRTASAVWSVVYTDGDGRITGAAEWYDSTTTYLVWTTATKVNRTALPSNWTTDVNAGSWQKTNLTSQTWHSLAQANGALMICNGKFLGMIGYDSSYTNEALLLRPGVTSKAITEYGNQVMIGGGDGSRESWLLTWEQTAISWLNKNRIPSKTINAIVQSELLLMSAGDNLLYYSDMVNNMPVCQLDGKANPGGVTEQGGLALFGLFGGSYSGIWSYGRKKKNESHTLNLEQYLQAEEIGALGKIAEQVFVSYQQSTTHAIKKVDTATKAVAEYYSLDLTLPKESTVTSIDLNTKTIPTGCSIAVYYDLDHTGVWTQAIMADEVTTATAGMRDPSFLCGSYGRVLNLKVVLTPSGNTTPTVKQIFANFN